MIITVENLTKKYGDFTAVDDISFAVEEGALFAFLGKNGAGKSTTVNILCTLLEKNGGRVEIHGHELGKEDDAIRRSIGIVFQESVLDDLLSVRENLRGRAAMYGISPADFEKRLAALSAEMGLPEILDKRYGKLSGGQRRRADIARALIHSPSLLFLDEPTTGLDPQTRIDVWNTVQRLRENSGMTVFLTTHYMEEAAKASHVVVIDRGKLIASGTPMELKAEYTTDSLSAVPKDGRLAEYLTQKNIPFTRRDELVTAPVESSMDALAILDGARELIADFEVLRGSMDDVFLNVLARYGQSGEEDAR